MSDESLRDAVKRLLEQSGRDTARAAADAALRAIIDTDSEPPLALSLLSIALELRATGVELRAAIEGS